MSRFPKLSETFILREMEALERRGWQIDVFPFVRLNEPVRHAEVDRWIARMDRPATITTLALALVFWLVHKPGAVFELVALVLQQLWRRPGELVRASVAVLHAGVWAKQVQERGIAHVHAHFALHPAVGAMAVAHLTGISFSFTCHGNDVYLRPAFLRAKARRADFVIAVSELLRDQYLTSRLRRIDGPEVSVIRCGVELTRFRQRSSPSRPEGLIILAVARLIPVKGLTYLVDACALLRDRGYAFRCTIIGDGPLRDELQEQIRTSALEGLVHLDGPRSSTEVQAAFEQATVFVQPSMVTSNGTMEGVPVSLMEAMAIGVPVVATRAGAVGELVENEHTGLLVGSADAAALAGAIVQLTEDPGLAGRLVRNARRRIEADFDVDANAGKLGELLTVAIAR